MTLGRILLSILGILALALGAAWFLLLAPLAATGFAETPCGGDSACATRRDDGIAALSPDRGSEPLVGFVLYTGARVTQEAYAPVAERVA